MPREKQYGSPAERQKAYRERRAKEQLVDPELPVVDLNQIDEPEPPAREPLVSLERYVADAREGALQFSRSIGEDDGPFEIASGLFIKNRRRDRLERAEQYARWRYAGFRSGEVASL